MSGWSKSNRRTYIVHLTKTMSIRLLLKKYAQLSRVNQLLWSCTDYFFDGYLAFGGVDQLSIFSCDVELLFL